jgi:hypothetical protein
LRRLAWPSRPRPQTPTRAPDRSDQESFSRDEVLADRPQHGGGVRRGRRVRPPGDLGSQFPQQAGAGPVIAPRGQQHRGPALADLADALERLGARAEQGPELAGQPRIVERLTGYREDPPQRRGRQERREDQVDEAALVALPAPVVEPSGPFGIKSLVAAAE